MQRLLQQMTDDHDIDIATPFAKQTKIVQEEIVNGGKGRGAFVGLVPYLKELAEAGDENSANELDELMTELPCVACQGRRLNPARPGGQGRRQNDLASGRPVRR